MPTISAAGKAMARSCQPQRGKYFQLLCRFYETYMLLIVHDPFRDVRDPKPDHTSPLGRRRQFVDDLAFLCEFEKGGDACTAIAIEERPDTFVYHVAANTDPTKKIVPFLRSLLQKLCDIAALSNDERQQETDALAAWCIDFACAKVLSLGRLLALKMERCFSRLETHGSTTHDELKSWLDQFRLSLVDSRALVGLCQLAFHARKSRGIKLLQAASGDPFLHAASQEHSNPFSDARHYIGRLADHIRVAHRVVVNLSMVQDLVGAFKVEAIPVCASVGAPPVHSGLSLDGICTRMFPPHKDCEKQTFQTHLAQRHNLLDDLAVRYARVKTRVHAEVQVAEDFYAKKRTWAGGDRYIGVSKAACYACQLYLSHHPANLVPRPSHMKAYPNWCPPLLADGAQDKDYIHQRDILNKVIASMRESLIRQVCEPRPRHPWRADSHTGITSTVAVTEHHAGEDADDDTDSASIDSEVDLVPEVQGADSSRSSLLSDISEADPAGLQQVDEDSESDSDGGALL